MVLVVSGSGTTRVGGLTGTVVVIVGSGEGEIVEGRLAETAVVVGRSSGVTVLLVVVGTYAGSTGAEGTVGTLLELLEGTLLVVVAVNIGAVDVR